MSNITLQKATIFEPIPIAEKTYRLVLIPCHIYENEFQKINTSLFETMFPHQTIVFGCNNNGNIKTRPIDLNLDDNFARQLTRLEFSIPL